MNHHSYNHYKACAHDIVSKMHDAVSEIASVNGMSFDEAKKQVLDFVFYGRNYSYQNKLKSAISKALTKNGQT